MNASRLATVCLLAILTLYAVVGATERMRADDFCQAADAQDYGPLGMVAYRYQTWNGRYSQLAFSGTLYAVFGSNAPRVTPALVIASLVVSLRWAFRPMTRHAALIALTVTYGILACLPDLHETLYWIPGSMTYLAPLICAALVFGLAARSVAS